MGLKPWCAIAAIAGVSSLYAQPPLVIAGQRAVLELTAVSEVTLRVRLSPLDASGVPARSPAGPALTERAWTRPLLVLSALAAPRTVRAGALAVTVAPQPLRVRISSTASRARQELGWLEDTGEMQFPLGAGPLFGLGQGGAQFDRRGKRHSMASAYNPPEGRDVHGTRTPVPWLMGADGWGIFFNLPRGEIDLTGTGHGRLIPPPGASAPAFDVFVSLTGNGERLMHEYAALTGFARMPPLWSLGYMQSHRTLIDRPTVLELARKLRERRIPADGLIYLGTGFCPSGWNNGHGDFNWNPKVFPDPARDMAELRAMNFRVILHLTRPPEDLFGSVNDPPEDAVRDNSAAAYWRRHAAVFLAGVSGWWPDEGEAASDNARLARNRMYWEGPLRERPAERPFALHRAGYAGMQRYGAWLWTGDPASSWSALASHVPIGINTGLSGVPMWGHDIGGFFSTPEFNGELYARWFQFGAFSPLFRSHGRPSYLHFPWSWNSGTFGPPELQPERLPDASELRNPAIEPICRKYAELRYRLLPYLYSSVRETVETGLPIMRALWLHYADDPAARARGDEYLWGRDILVAPVVEKGATSRRLYLPRGDWYDFWTNAKLRGGRVIERQVDLETMPIYVRAGSVIPMGPVRQHTADLPDAPVELVVYPGANGRGLVYRDDGISFGFEKGAFTKVRCVWNDASRQLSVRLDQGSRPAPIRFRARLAGSATAREWQFEGKPWRGRL